MSHFTVLVIGDDPRQQMEKYSETKEVEPYKDYVDMAPPDHVDREWCFEVDWAITVEARDAWVEKHGIETAPEDMDYKEYEEHFRSDEFNEFKDSFDPSFDPNNPSREDLERIAELLSREDRKAEVDEVGLFRWSTYNPDSKWDWYSLGGRWRGFFMVKEDVEMDYGMVDKASDLITEDGTHLAIGGESGAFGNEAKFQADQALAGDIDWEAMREAERGFANEAYDEYEEAIKGTVPIIEFEEYLRKHDIDPDAQRSDGDKEALEQARKEYHAQERVKALKDANLWPFLSSPKEVYKDSREEYVKSRVSRIAIPYAIVREGGWLGKGDMGWFGMSANEMDQDMWSDAVHGIYSKQEPDTLLTLLDCHI